MIEYKLPWHLEVYILDADLYLVYLCTTEMLFEATASRCQFFFLAFPANSQTCSQIKNIYFAWIDFQSCLQMFEKSILSSYNLLITYV